MHEDTPLPEDAMVRILARVVGHGTFEAHITITAKDDETREQFRSRCHALGVKPVLIDLPEGVTPSQPMTSSYHRGTVEDAAKAAAELTRAVRASGFAVTRVKLEAVATNHGVPSDHEAANMPRDCYFEFHIKLLLSPDADEPRLQEVCRRHSAHLSRNAFKKRSDGLTERFVTMRVYHTGKQTAFRHLDALATELNTAGFEIANIQREYSLFDSHVGLDAGWLDAPAVLS
jgi:hypothetical protein